MGGEIITLLSDILQFIAIKPIGNPNKSTDRLTSLYVHTVFQVFGVLKF
jgi:hypothetical protein